MDRYLNLSGYTSPFMVTERIKYDFDSVRKVGDELVVQAVRDIGIDVDEEELRKALQYDRDQYDKGYKDRDDKLIRCRDCKYARKSLLFKGKLKCRCRPGAFFYTLPDDFCSCGRHKT